MAEKLEVLITAKDEASKVFKDVSNTLKGSFKVGLAGAGVGFGLLSGAIGVSIKEAMDAEKVQAELAAVIKSTGGAAGWSAQEANDLAEELSNVTTYSDDAIVAGESMLLTFTNIGEDVFPMATEAMLNMTEKFGSVDQASVMLGKALNDPIAGVTALRRVGVQLSDEQERQIKRFMALGDVESAQKVILGELEKEFGGLAKATGNTLAGKLTILRNKLLNVAETIGNALLPIFTKVVDAIAGKIIPAVVNFGEGIANIITAIRAFGLDSKLALWAFESLFGDELGTKIYNIVKAIATVAGTLKNFVTGVILPFISQHAEAFKAALIAIGAVLAGAAVLGGILSVGGAIAALFNPITLIIGAIALLAAAWTENWGGIRDFVTNLWNGTIKPALSEMAANLAVVLPLAVALASAVWNNTLKPALEKVWGFIQGSVIPIFRDLAAWLAVNIPVAVSIVTAFWNGTLKPSLQDVWNFITGSLIPTFGDIVAWLALNIPLAVGIVAGFWNNTLKPALSDVWGFIVNSVIPAFQDVLAWLAVNIPLAVSVAASFWNNTLKPAFSDVWAFITDSVIPIFQELLAWLAVNIPLAVSMAASFWNNTLKPALSDVWGFIQNSVIPAFQSVFNWLVVNIPLAVMTAANFWNNTLRPAFEKVRDAAGEVITKVGEVIAKIGEFVGVPVSWETLKTTVINIKNNLGWLFDRAGEVISKVAEFVFPEIWTTFQTLVINVKNNLGWVSDRIQWVIDKLATVVVPDAVTQLKDTWQAIKDFISPIAGFIGDVIGKLGEIVVPDALTLIEALWEGIKAAAEGLAGLVQGFIDALGKLEVPGALKDIADLISKITSAPGWVIDKVGGALGLAEGGPVVAGKPYIVGEQGPEWFVPGRSGRILPNSTPINYTLIINTNAGAESVVNDFNLMRSWARA